jgi:hypothetical protein
LEFERLIMRVSPGSGARADAIIDLVGAIGRAVLAHLLR